jgi:hypothetical protein
MGVSRRGGNFIMETIHLLLTWVMTKENDRIGALDRRVLIELPQSINVALSHFGVEGRTTKYAVCPSCNYTYEPALSSGSYPKYPPHCTNTPRPDSPICNTPLLGHNSCPVKIYIYHHFHNYLVRLLSDSALEMIMNQACNCLMESVHNPPPELIKDFFEAQFICAFEGPQSGKLFVDRGNESHFLFYVNINFFSNEGLSHCGPATSCGVISMACLNLPFTI